MTGSGARGHPVEGFPAEPVPEQERHRPGRGSDRGHGAGRGAGPVAGLAAGSPSAAADRGLESGSGSYCIPPPRAGPGSGSSAGERPVLARARGGERLETRAWHYIGLRSYGLQPWRPTCCSGRPWLSLVYSDLSLRRVHEAPKHLGARKTVRA